jgi:hypothetical protein
MTSMDKISFSSSQQPFQPSILLVQQQQQINKTRPHRPLSIIPNQQPVVKKNICSKSLIYPFMAWFLFIILTILYFIFV